MLLFSINSQPDGRSLNQFDKEPLDKGQFSKWRKTEHLFFFLETLQV